VLAAAASECHCLPPGRPRPCRVGCRSRSEVEMASLTRSRRRLRRVRRPGPGAARGVNLKGGASLYAARAFNVFAAGRPGPSPARADRRWRRTPGEFAQATYAARGIALIRDIVHPPRDAVTASQRAIAGPPWHRLGNRPESQYDRAAALNNHCQTKNSKTIRDAEALANVPNSKQVTVCFSSSVIRESDSSKLLISIRCAAHLVKQL
jgi:hypothetical protein